MVIEIAPETTTATPQEQAPVVETKTGPDIYVEGEPLPPGVLASAKETAPETATAAPQQETVAPAPVSEDPAQKAIESKMETGVEEAFGALEPLAQQAFLARGQEAAFAVRNLLTAPTLDAKTVKGLTDTVRGWLALLPGASPVWLEQQTWATVGSLMEIRGS